MGVTIYRASGSQTYTYRQYTLQSIPDIYTMYNSPLPLDLLPNTAFPLPSSSLPASPTIATSSKSRSTMRLNYPEEIDLGTFIVERWKQAGVGHVFGVPGDFNLGFLDYIEEDPQIEWVGTASELGAGYAVDGYARVKGGLGVLVTTYGVGETSTYNPICGMQSERIPCLHLVGLPSTQAFKQGKLLHHTLGDGDLGVFVGMSKAVGGGSAVGVIGLGSDGFEEEGWTETVDRVMRVAMAERRPVYLGLPQDLVSRKVSSRSLYTPLGEPASNDIENQAADELANRIVDKIRSVNRPIVIGDFYAQRFGFGEQMRGLCDALGIRYFGRYSARAMLDEQTRLYGGIYSGKTTDQAAKLEVETADMCLIVGRMDSDLNTGMFTAKLPFDTVSINLDDTVFDGETYKSIGMVVLLPRLTVLARKTRPNAWDEKIMFEPRSAMEELGMNVGNDKLDHEKFWGRMQKFFRDDDVIFSDVGTSSMGIVNVTLPTRARVHFQHLWASIGWSGGAVLGGALAARETPDHTGNPPRTIVFIGDGALQMTLQEIGSIIRNRLPVYFFINNNNGYEIERQIHGPTAKYNDIQTYDHHLMIRALAGPLYDEFCVTHKVKTQQELDTLLQDPEFHTPGKFRMIEFCLPQGDAPRALKLLQGGFNVPDRVKVKIPSRPMTPVSISTRIPSRPSTPVSALRKERPIGPFTPEPRGMAF
ncbi:hypothetical protein FFLO_04711 [Filobasidium floriforme]|uniref:Pyruvate decarboxylase n=1 Tax=Filobasidium floriforme TaxID=5210 RepID=A0A8K0NPK6_9TREE|nr:hypothetical protein FFLO_04711 [Filobasidium floriforme]